MWFNPIMKFMLQSPLHPLVSSNMMLISYLGRRSGRGYTVPVSYLGIGDDLITVSSRDRVWWRNLRGGAQVSLRLRGVQVPAWAQAEDQKEQVAKTLTEYAQAAPSRIRFLGVQMDPQGAIPSEERERFTQERVFVRVRLGQSGSTPNRSPGAPCQDGQR